MTSTDNAANANRDINKKHLLADGDIGRAFSADYDGDSAPAAVYVKLSSIFIDKANNARDINSDKYSPASIAELSAQIKTTGGLLQPIIITPLNAANEETEFKEFILVSGYRRCLALQKLSHDEEDPTWVTRIPARVAEISDHATFSISQAIENIGRADFTPLETCELLKNVISESRGRLNQAQLGALIGLSASAVSKYLSLQKLSDEIKKMVASGALSFTNASLLCSGEYAIEEQNMVRLAKIGCKFTSSAFRDLLNSRYKKSSDPKKASTPGSKWVKPTLVEKVFIPFLKEKIAEKSQEKLEKVYTEADILAARMDMIEAFKGEKCSFAEQVEPFRQKIEELSNAEKQTEKQVKGKAKFIASLVKRVRDLMKLPPVDGARPFPNVASALVKIGGSLSAMKQADIDKLEFKIDIANGLQDILNTVKDEYLKQDKELAKKREAAKKKKEQEEKDKAKGDKAKGDKAKGEKDKTENKGAVATA